jgi:exodeoxyribonuclease V beta subunit
LTCFFRIAPHELALAQDLPARHPARRLYQGWLEMAERRRWSALFQSLLEETGVLLQQDDLDGAHRRANFRQLCAVLEQVGHGENRDLLGLLDWIKARRKQREANEADLQPESQRHVKIMTVHASKGLEFPIVFLAGGFTRRRQSGPATYRDERGRLVFDLCPGAEAQQRVEEETQSEQRRLLYVALTRPIFKLYVPRLQPGPKSKTWAGPLATVLLPALESSAAVERLGFPVVDLLTPGLRTEASPTAAPTEAPRGPSPFVYDGPLFPQFDRQLDKRRIVIRSFSSMSRHHVTPLGEGASYGDAPVLAVDETASAAEPDDALRGAAFGDIVHGVLEQIDFAEVARAAHPEALLRPSSAARRLLEREVRANLINLRTRIPAEQLEQRCLDEIAPLVWQALHTPLAAPGCRLCELPASDRLHELEFYYPDQAPGRREESFLAGIMDLVFRKNGRYFLVDYKTNRLPSYAPEHVARSMAEADYHLQYRIYLQALERWLRRVHGPAFDFAHQFGGVYYLYVRGLNGRDESAGVFYHHPAQPTPASP